MTARRSIRILVALTLVTGVLLFVQTVFAQDLGINEVGNVIALRAGDPRVIAMQIVRVALGFLGIIALAIVLYGGFVWMTSAGNEEKISQAKKILTNGVIGLIIILSAFGITQWVLNTLLGAVGPGGGGGISGPPAVGRYSGALGNGIIESHYPPRGGTGIARNTKIIVTFKEPMSLETIIEGYDDRGTADLADDTVGGTAITSATILPLKSENIRIYKSADGETGTGGAANYLQPAAVKVTFTDDFKNFVFDPVNFLGSPSENVWYTVAIKPGVKKADGSDAFLGAFRDGYAWDFETSTIIDTTPPQVESAWPWPEGVTVARNTLIQINFDEAMDPTTVSGEWPASFGIIETVIRGGAEIAGKWEISNQYKTVEFTTGVPCGTNSCGGTVYCLPASEDVDVLVKAATLGETPPEALAPSDGVTDAAGNSLDGNKNGAAEGSALDTVAGVDDFGLAFSTNNEIRLTPPKVEAVNPPATPPGNSNVISTAPVEITFDGIMSMGSFSTSNIILDDNQDNAVCAVWFTNGGVNLKEEPAGIFVPVESTDDVAVKTRVNIYHGDFIPSNTTPPQTCSDGAAVDHDPVAYYPRSTHRVKDIYQNCFYPPAASGSVGGQSCTGTLPAPSGPCSKWGAE
jgi:hypothetical protein